MNMKQTRVLNATELKRILTICAVGRYGQRNRLAVLLSHYAGLSVVLSGILICPIPSTEKRMEYVLASLRLNTV